MRFILYFLDLVIGLFMEKKILTQNLGWKDEIRRKKHRKLKKLKVVNFIRLYSESLNKFSLVNRVVLNCYYTNNFISKNKEWNTKYIKQCPTRCIMDLDPLESTEILKDNDISKVKIIRCSNQPCEKWNKH